MHKTRAYTDPHENVIGAISGLTQAALGPSTYKLHDLEE